MKFIYHFLMYAFFSPRCLRWVIFFFFSSFVVFKWLFATSSSVEIETSQSKIVVFIICIAFIYLNTHSFIHWLIESLLNAALHIIHKILNVFSHCIRYDRGSMNYFILGIILTNWKTCVGIRLLGANGFRFYLPSRTSYTVVSSRIQIRSFQFQFIHL